MTMDERELQKRMKDAVSGANPDSAKLWENVMDGTNQAHKSRNAKRTAITLTVLAFAAAAPFAIGLLGSDDSGFAEPDNSNSPTPSPTETTATPTPNLITSSYVDTQLNVTFVVPPDWRISEFEGHRTIVPEGLPMPPQDGDTAVMQMTFGDLAPKQGRVETSFSGYPAHTVKDGLTEWIVVDWPASPLCTVCDAGPISIWWEASNEALWDEYQSGFDTMRTSLTPLFDADGEVADVAAAEILTRRGTVAAGVEMNSALATTIDFLDRRMWMDTFRPVLSAEGKAAYKSLPPFGPHEEARLAPVQLSPSSYRIGSIEAADANSFEIQAEVRYVDYSTEDSNTLYGSNETMFVGPGTSLDSVSRNFVIRGVAEYAPESVITVD